ncbi:MAG: hypothetical protein ABFC62_10355 [Clostridiaceae bacterium]
MAESSIETGVSDTACDSQEKRQRYYTLGSKQRQINRSGPLATLPEVHFSRAGSATLPNPLCHQNPFQIGVGNVAHSDLRYKGFLKTAYGNVAISGFACWVLGYETASVNRMGKLT